MKNQKSNIAANLRFLRMQNHLSQEAVAEHVGVTRQAVAKWENGDTLPDLLNCETLADLYDVSLNDLVRYDPEQNNLPIGPKEKHFFGTVTIGERGQIVLPKKARDIMKFEPGDILVVLGDTNPGSAGVALISSDVFLKMADEFTGALAKNEGE